MLLRYILFAGWLVGACHSTPDMYGIMNILYLRVNPGLDNNISLDEMASIYTNLDYDDDKLVSETEFVKGWTGLTQQSKEMAEAYFQLADVDNNKVLNQSDSDRVFKLFDIDESGFVSGDEFRDHFVLVFRTMPFVVLFNRVRANNSVTAMDLSKDMFKDLFQSLNIDADGSISRQSMAEGWESQGFGTKIDADDTVTSLDTNQDGVVSKAELGSVFDELDDDSNDQLDLDELREIVPKTRGIHLTRVW